LVGREQRDLARYVAGSGRRLEGATGLPAMIPQGCSNEGSRADAALEESFGIEL